VGDVISSSGDPFSDDPLPQETSRKSTAKIAPIMPFLFFSFGPCNTSFVLKSEFKFYAYTVFKLLTIILSAMILILLFMLY